MIVWINPSAVALALSWGDVGSVAREVLEVLGVVGIMWTVLWTVLRSFTRERLYKLLLSSFGARSGFVIGVINHEQHRNTFAKIVFDCVSNDDNKHRLKAIVSELYHDEMAENRKARENLNELGRLVGDAVTRSQTVEEMAVKIAETQTEMAKSHAVMAKAMEGFGENVRTGREEIGKLSDKFDRMQELLMESSLLNRRRND